MGILLIKCGYHLPIRRFNQWLWYGNHTIKFRPSRISIDLDEKFIRTLKS